MVKAGQTVGLSGQTGLATGPHLHWEVRLNSEAVSPDFFTGDFTFSEE
jgi:murein DD-endopeptidase MepM/ murein hydrolase activator NlpD